MIRQVRHQPRLRRAGLRACAAFIALLAFSVNAAADPFTLYGQVFQVDPELAADESIEDADLPVGLRVPFVQVQVVDPDTGESRGAPVFAGANGNFTLHFDAPAGSTAAIQVFRSVNTTTGDPEVQIYPEARKDLNTFPLTNAPTGVAVKVASEETLLLDPGSSFNASVGIVFTQVGLVEIPYISQDLARPDKGRIGLADLSGDLTRAAEQNLSSDPSAASYNAVFKDAPFGGLLHVFGAFGKLSGIPPCTGAVDWYRVKIRPVSFDGAGNPVYGAAFEGTDLLRKMRFEVDYVPTFRADSFLEKIGPYDGDDLTSGVAVPIHNLYRVNPSPTTPGQTVVYSMADQRYSWATGGNPPGLYEISLEYFRDAGTTDPTQPRVTKIADAPCFGGTLPPEDADEVALHKLLVRIDNTPLESSMDGLFVRTGASRSFNYLEPGHLCDIIDLNAGSTIEIDFKAWHNAGYLRSYRLTAISNAKDNVPFAAAADNYDNHSACGPLWRGGTGACPAVAPPGAAPVITATSTSPFPRCAYGFDLVVQGRAQNGYGYLQGAHHRQIYYVNPLP